MHAQTAVGRLLSTISVVSQDLVPVSDVPKLNLGLPILGVLGTQVTVLVIAGHMRKANKKVCPAKPPVVQVSRHFSWQLYFPPSNNIHIQACGKQDPRRAIASVRNHHGAAIVVLQ
jgi:hypothetical protein